MMSAEFVGLRNARTIIFVAAFTGVIGLGWPVATLAQNYPASVVKIVVPFPGGGPLDFTARLLADKLAARLKQPFIVENRPGASGNLGTEAVARAAPDGHTLLFVLDTPLTVHPSLYKKLPFHPERDLTPISIVASFSQMLVIHPSVAASSVAEFVALAKQRPITYGSGGGKGDPGHLTMEYFRLQAGFEATHVPYKGNAQVVTDLVSGQVQAGFVATPGVLQHAKEGRLRGLAVSSAQRTPGAPEIPTIAESGYPSFEVGFYQAMFAPAGVRDSIVTVLEREVQEAMKSPDVQARLRAQELNPIGSTAAEAKAQLQGIAQRWREVITAAHIQID
jgi:tripartite-type tricarboxylate transporter receptor subunit TctC